MVRPAATHKQCGRCKQAFYCNAVCQKRHWKREGHKKACEEPPCCTICLDGGDEPLPFQCGCGCRGAAGLAHMKCKIEGADHRGDEYHPDWYLCATCLQAYTGAMSLGLVRELVRRSQHLQLNDPRRMAFKISLCCVLQEEGLLDEAEAVSRQCWEAQARIEGPNGLMALQAASTLGLILYKLGRLDEGEALLREVLAAQKEFHGDAHETIVNTQDMLTCALQGQGKLEEAESLVRLTLAHHVRIRGPEDSSTLNVSHNLAEILVKRGQFAEAESLHRTSLAAMKRILGDKHPSTILSESSLADLLNRVGESASYGKGHVAGGNPRRL